MFYVNGRIRKLTVSKEFGGITNIYVSDSLKGYTLEDIISKQIAVQFIKYPNGNIVLIPANESVDLGVSFDGEEKGLSRIESVEDITSASDTAERVLSLREFVKSYRTVRFGIAYNTISEKDEPACCFQTRDWRGVVVFNPNEFTFKQMVQNSYKLLVIEMKSGHYFLEGNVEKDSATESSFRAFQDKNAYDLREVITEEEIQREAEERRQRAIEERKVIEKIRERNANRFPYDLSGDDSSLDSRHW